MDRQMEILLNIILGNLQHFMHPLVVVHLRRLKIPMLRHLTTIQTICIQPTILQMMSTIAFNPQVTTIINLLIHIRCKTTIQIVTILNYPSVTCIKILVHRKMQVITPIQPLPRHQIFHLLHRVLTIINGIISNLMEDVYM